MEVISLRVKDFKKARVGLESYNYYVKVYFGVSEGKILKCKNLLEEDGVFELRSKGKLSKLEIWHQSSNRKIQAAFVEKSGQKGQVILYHFEQNLLLKIEKKSDNKFSENMLLDLLDDTSEMSQSWLDETRKKQD